MRNNLKDNERISLIDQPQSFLTGQLLIATPTLNDTDFERSVIYICAHTEDETMGIIINKGHQGLLLSELLSELNIEGLPAEIDGPVLSGGPVSGERGFVLHPKTYYMSDTTLTPSETIALTTSREILEQLCQPPAPDFARLALGYAGWGAGQLEQEIMDNVWLNAPYNEAIIFDTPLHQIWKKALQSIGVAPEMISHVSGQA